ncbi:MAG: hypothetical protein AAGA46_10050 [Cyanobacteria bacterium P01_F01_bin.13]
MKTSAIRLCLGLGIALIVAACGGTPGDATGEDTSTDAAPPKDESIYEGDKTSESGTPEDPAEQKN